LNGIIVNETNFVIAPTKDGNPISSDSDKPDRISQNNGATVQTNDANRVVIHLQADVRRASPLDKELPPKPVLCKSESSERRGILGKNIF
jgi:hypothetical protein